jgi:hypothetical protein
LTSCDNNDDCGVGTCKADGTCTVAGPGPSCDCSNLNYCSGISNGTCTPECTCVCHEGWTGAQCDTPDRHGSVCSEHVTCEECASDTFGGCVYCEAAIGGATGVCVTSDQCLVPQDGCGEIW